MSYSKKLLLIIYFLIIATINLQSRNAEHGVLDLRGWDLQNNGSIALNGEWEIYLNELYTPEDFINNSIKNPQFIEIPSIWNIDGLNGQKLPEHGYVTYRLKVKLDKPEQFAALSVKEIYTAYKLWVNGDEVFSCGIPGKTKKETVPDLIPQNINVNLTEETEIIIQLSNFHYKDGGIKDPIILGTNKILTSVREKSLIINYIIFGSMLIIGLYHFGLFFQKKDDYSILLFGLFCIVMTTRILVTNENYIIHFLPNLPWEIRVKMIVLGYYIGMPVFINFIYTLFPDEFNKWILILTRIVGVTAVLLVLLTPVNIFTRTELYYQIFIMIVSIYTLAMVFKAMIRKREAARGVLIGVALLFLAVINDILYAQHMRNITNKQSMVPLAIFLFILIHAFILSIRYSKAIKNANIDVLCQINNRRVFFELVDLEIERTIRSKKYLSFLTIDIDFFKNINDTYGHNAGDKVLTQMSQLISDNIRLSDIFGRVGGEEFGLILGDTPLKEAIVFANRLREKVSDNKVLISDNKEVSITISIGITEFSGLSPVKIETLIKNSDEALYNAKHNGRNSVSSY